MNGIRASCLVAAASLAACSAPGGAVRAAAEEGKVLLVEPYLWIPSQKGEVPDEEGDDTDVDLIGFDTLDAALMFALEVRPPETNWAALVDSVYARFEDEGKLLRVQTGVQMFEAAAAWGPDRWRGVELLAGLRYWRLWAELGVSSLGVRQEEIWVDPVLGVRGTYPLGQAWTLHGRGDIGGFGLEADWVYQLRADVRYAFGPRWELELGYRYVYIEFDDFNYEVALAGPSFGVRWSP